MPDTTTINAPVVVALLAEGVDRNLVVEAAIVLIGLSPSSRRAWIEMFGFAHRIRRWDSRPPRGGRG